MNLLRKACSIMGLCAAVSIVLASYAACENFQYSSHGKRDPFIPLVGRDRPAVEKLENITSVADIKLEGIAVTKGRRVAIINGEILRENDKVGEVELKKIDKRSITLLISGKPYEINLSEEEQGGVKSGR